MRGNHQRLLWRWPEINAVVRRRASQMKFRSFYDTLPSRVSATMALLREITTHPGRQLSIALLLFTARRYASAAYAVVACPSDRHKPVFYRNDWTNQASFRHGSFIPPIPDCGVRKFGYRQKLRYFPLELSPKLRTWKFRRGKSIALSTTLVVVVVDGRACWRHTTIDESWLFTTSLSTVTL